MSRPIGSPKTGGRIKGTPNHASHQLQIIFEAAGLDVPARIVSLIPSLSPQEQIRTLLDLMSYLYPKRKAIEGQIAVESRESEMEKLSDEEINKKMAKIFQTSARKTKEPEIAEAYQTLADYHGSLGSTPEPSI